jgi:DNA-binding transcriptional regulator YhcF (GntR family)
MSAASPTPSVRRLPPVASLREQVHRALVAAIVAGELEPGELVSVPTLAARFDVSATPVREAVLDLERRGFLEAVRNKGFRVTRVSDQTLRHVAAVRLVIEPVWMERLAKSFPVGQLQEFRALADEIVESARTGDLIAYLQADQAVDHGRQRHAGQLRAGAPRAAGPARGRRRPGRQGPHGAAHRALAGHVGGQAGGLSASAPEGPKRIDEDRARGWMWQRTS